METKAFLQFKKTIQRSEALISFYIKNKNNKGIALPKDIVRGAVVLSVAAFDAYVSNVFVETLIPYIQKYPLNNELVKLLEVTGFNTKMAIELLNSQNPYKKIRLLVENYYMKQTTHRLTTVNKLFSKYNIEDIVKQAAAITKGKNTARSIEVLIEKRHQIAHNGDYSKTGKLLDIDEKNMAKRINDLALFVESMDKIIRNIAT